MADLLHNNLSNSFIFSPLSLPLNLSHHPNFSFIRFAPLKRRFSHFTSLASHSSQFHITSRTEHADGSVIFKFGDVSEVSEIVDDFGGEDEVELEKDDNDGELADEISVVEGDESVDFDEEIVKNSVELKEVDDDFVEDELKIDSTATAEVENSSDFVEDELKSGLHSTEVVENSSDSISTDELEKSNSFVRDELESDLNLTVEVEDLSVCVEDELKGELNSTLEVENLSSFVDDELKTVKSDSNSTAEVEASADFDTALTSDSTDEMMIEESDTLTEESEENSSDESNIVSDTSSDVEAVASEDETAENVVEDNNDTLELMTERFEAEQVFAEEGDDKVKSLSEQLNAESILDKEDEDKVELVAEQLEAELVIEEEDEDSLELMPQQLEAEPILDEEVSFDSLDEVVALGSTKVALPSHPSIANSDDEPITHNISHAALGVEASGITSTEMKSDSMKTSTAVSSMTQETASSPDSSEDYEIATHSITQSGDNQSDILVATGPVKPGIASVKASLDSLNKVEIAASPFSVSSSVASLAHSLEDLTGGKDSYFVSDNWFGVADGVGRWSFGGVDIGLYAHELMQNCEMLLKSTDAGLTNVKELLQKSAAMTQSTGSARVIIAHVANQVLHVANIGDSGFVIIRNGTVFKKSSPMFHEFSFPYAIGLDDDSVEDAEEYHIELEDGDVIVTATDGLFDNLYDQEIASIVSKAVETGIHAQGLAELLATKAQEVGMSESARSPFADAAQAAGHSGYSGGKFDHVTVIVSLVQIR